MTTLTIITSNQSPIVDSSATFTVTLRERTTGLSKPIRIWHFLPSGELHENGTHQTGTDGIYTFAHKYASVGQRIYYAEFSGDGTCLRSKGSVTVNVRSK